jgi:hypothetical protein
VAHGKLVFDLPSRSVVAFEAFFNHRVRSKWDTLLDVNYVEGGGDHPYVGAITVNEGGGWKAGLSMRTRFLTYDPPNHASAVLIAPMGPFDRWGASMRFADAPHGGCVMTYTFTIHLRPRWLGTLLDPLGGVLFTYETRRRFRAMARYLHDNGVAV